MLKVYALFVFFEVVFFALLVTPWGKQYISAPLNNLIAVLSGWLIRLLGSEATVSGTSILSSAGAVNIKEGCNGIYATVILLAGVVSFPATWKAKLAGVVFGTLALFLINLIRVLTLFYLSSHDAEIFDEAHLFIWQFAIIIAAGLLWLLWYDKIASRSPGKTGI